MNARAEERKGHWPRYGVYKVSGIDWLAEMPAHWNSMRLRFTVRGCLTGIWGEEADGGQHDLPCVRVADFDRTELVVRGPVPTLRKITPSERRRRLLGYGDLLLEKSGGGDQQPVGVVVLYDSTDAAVCSNFVARMEVVPGNSPRFLAYLHACLYSGRLNERSIKQTTGIQNLDAGSYLDERAPLPPVDEQRAVAAFLDRETARLDGLIEKRQRMISLLQEKRASLITHAVTRGIDAGAPLKDSGIEWLGQIPRRWRLVPLKKYLQSIVDYRGATPTKVDDGVFLVTTSNIRAGRIDYAASAEFIDAADYNSVMRRGKLQMGDVLFTMEAPLGQVANVDRLDVALAQRIVKFRPLGQHLDPYFLKYWILGSFFQQDVSSYSTGSTAQGIKASKLGYLKGVLPPLLEQREIVLFLDRELLLVERMADTSRKIIDRVTEYRASLITAAVTGQIDVRHATDRELQLVAEPPASYEKP